MALSRRTFLTTVAASSAAAASPSLLDPAPAAAASPAGGLRRRQDHRRLPGLVRLPPATFDPSGGNSVSVSLPPASTRYLRVHVTANTGWPAGQLSTVESYAS